MERTDIKITLLTQKVHDDFFACMRDIRETPAFKKMWELMKGQEVAALRDMLATIPTQDNFMGLSPEERTDALLKTEAYAAFMMEMEEKGINTQDLPKVKYILGF